MTVHYFCFTAVVLVFVFVVVVVVVANLIFVEALGQRFTFAAAIASWDVAVTTSVRLN